MPLRSALARADTLGRPSRAQVLFTSVPIIVYGVNDMDLPKSIAASQPRAYSVGIRQTRYTHTKFSGWMAEAFFCALLCTFVGAFGYMAYGDDVKNEFYLNFPKDSLDIQIAEWVLCFVLVISFILQMYPVILLLLLVLLVFLVFIIIVIISGSRRSSR